LERWHRVSRRWLRDNPLCAEHLRRGEVWPATLAHHVEGHPPNETFAQFLYGRLESLCHDCHNDLEQRGTLYQIGIDGYAYDLNGRPIETPMKSSRAKPRPKHYSTKRKQM
jgi:hypothetical protein